MDTKKSASGATASGGKQGEKKDENILTKTVHSIRDKVQEFTDEVKEKTHHKKHGADSKKSKKTADPKKTTGSKAAAASESDDKDSDSDTDQKMKPSPSASATMKKDKLPGADKGNTASSRSPATASTSLKSPATASTSSKSPATATTSLTTAAKKETAAPPPPSRSSARTAPSNDAASKPANDRKDTSAPKPSGPSVTFKEPESKPAPAKDNSSTANPPAAEAKSRDQVHISFDGIATVDDVLNRIDDAIEQAKIIVEGGKGNIGLTVNDKSKAPTATVADLEKKPVEKKLEAKSAEEPIRFNSQELHKVEDLLAKVNNQPGTRQVVLETNPTDKEQNPSSPAATGDNEEGSAAPKSILKTSQNPSSLDTSTKVASFEDDQVHVNVEDADDRTDEQSPASGEKKQAPKPAVETPSTGPATPNQTEKREAPKAPAPSGDHSAEAKKSSVPTIHVAEHEYEGQNNSNPPASSKKQKAPPAPPVEEDETSDWI